MSFNTQQPRRLGLTAKSSRGGLLQTVGGLSREEYDDIVSGASRTVPHTPASNWQNSSYDLGIDESPDPLANEIQPTSWTMRNIKPLGSTNVAAAANSDSDELSSAAHTISSGRLFSNMFHAGMDSNSAAKAAELPAPFRQKPTLKRKFSSKTIRYGKKESIQPFNKLPGSDSDSDSTIGSSTKSETKSKSTKLSISKTSQDSSSSHQSSLKRKESPLPSDSDTVQSAKRVVDPKTQRPVPKKADSKISSKFIDPTKRYRLANDDDDDDGMPKPRAPIGKTKEEALRTGGAIKAKNETARPPSPKKSKFVNPFDKYGLGDDVTTAIRTKAKKQNVSASFVDPTKKWSTSKEIPTSKPAEQANYDDMDIDAAISAVNKVVSGDVASKFASLIRNPIIIPSSSPQISSAPDASAAATTTTSSDPIPSSPPSSASQNASNRLTTLHLSSPPEAIQNPICNICKAPLPPDFITSYIDPNLSYIPLDTWSLIHSSHLRTAAEAEWRSKGYPSIDWSNLRHHALKLVSKLDPIIEGQKASPFRELFDRLVTETRGQAIKLLTRTNADGSAGGPVEGIGAPGYYGPRGSNIFLHVITEQKMRLLERASRREPGTIGKGGIQAYVQAVLVPELAVLLIEEDMDVGRKKAYEILEESADVGRRLNGEGVEEDVYGNKDQDDGWVDINNVMTQRIEID